MKKIAILFNFLFVLIWAYPSSLSAFATVNTSNISQMIPPQYAAKITSVKAGRTDIPINVDKLSRLAMIFGLLAPIGLLGFVYLLFLTGGGSIAGLFLSVAFSFLAFLIGNRVLKAQEATVKQKFRAKVGKILGIVTVSLILAGVLWGLIRHY